MSGEHGGKWLHDAGWFEYRPGLWFPGKKATETSFGCITRESIDAARNLNFKPTDVLTCTYPKTGWLGKFFPKGVIINFLYGMVNCDIEPLN